MSGPRDRYDSGKRAARKAVAADGLTYDQQRAIDPKIRQRIQDETAVHLLWRAFGRIENRCAGRLDRELVAAFIASLDDGSLAGMEVFVTDRRANDLIERVKHYDKRRAVAFRRTRRAKAS